MKLGLIAPAVALVAFGCGGRAHGLGAPEPDESGSAMGPLPDSGEPAQGLDAGSDVSVAPSSMDGGSLDGGSLDGAFFDGTVVALPLLRLTTTEYANTVNDLLSVPPSAQSVPLPFDSTAGGYAVGAPAVSDSDVQAYHDSAVLIASQVVANLPSLLAPVGCDATTGAACAATFIGSFAPLAFRHGAVDAATLAGLNQTFATIATAAGGATTATGFTMGLQAVIEQVLQSPYFLYHLEVEEEAKGVGQVAVSNYSMANRLSYLLWDSMPDSALFSAAAGNQLTLPEQISGQATRMLVDPKAKIGLRNFYQQWLEVTEPPTSKVGTSTQVLPDGSLSPASLFASGNGESFATVYSPAVQQAMVDSFDMQVDSALWAGSNALKTLLTGTTMYANEALAPILGASGVTGTALQPVTVDATKRTGILSHPLIMATFATTSTSHPIRRGSWVLRVIACQPPPSPPAGVPPFEVPAPGVSLRQEYELLDGTGPYAGDASLGQIGTGIACPSCHASMDPIGFLFEPYDVIGQFRTIDDYGQPVDLTNIVVAQVQDPSLDGLTASSMQLAQNLAQSDQPALCLMTNLYRFMAHRSDTYLDDPVETQLDAIFTASGQNLETVLVGLTQTQIFLERLNVP
jgi:hypothetical protein